ncbi:MAG TPA: ATP-binding protein [Actinomycetes bacterium]|jgi:signal transduction histidine kinase|nr:ATP-binding protein [Actinomycetes bacterium]
MAAERRLLRAWLRARLGTVRVRTTLAAVIVVGLAMGVGALVLMAVLRDNLTREVRNAARLRGQDVAAVLGSGVGPGPLAVDDAEELLIQVLDADGRVVRASANAVGLPPVARLRPGESAQVEAPVEEGEFLAVATGADTPQGPRTVVVVRSTETVTEATAAVGGLLAVGLPLLLLVVAASTWKAVGRTLAPVEAIRAEVDEISAAALHRRVPDPPADDEIGRLARTMNRMLGRLEQAQSRQRRLISDASHELRSPVAAIRQHAEVALAHPGQTTIGELAATVLAEDLRLQRLAEDLLLLTRADEHTLRLRRRPVDLDDLVFDEARHLRDATSLRVDTTAVSAGRVDGDAAGLRRVLRNLGDNAARHARGRLAFSVAERDGAVLLGVDDDGPGIPGADRERVFERFVRLDDARARDAGGSGLGLAIVAELVAAHGGTVAVAGSPLGGARVEVTLPRLGDPGD